MLPGRFDNPVTVPASPPGRYQIRKKQRRLRKKVERESRSRFIVKGNWFWMKAVKSHEKTGGRAGNGNVELFGETDLIKCTMKISA